MTDLPDLALSVRQPWAWAIVAGHKPIENRSAGSIRAGGMVCRRIAIHAATGMTRKEYEWAVWRLDKHGVVCPGPLDLPRGAIIGAVDVIGIISKSDSDWFGGQMGLVLANPEACVPTPATGALGYFSWRQSGLLARPARWMDKWSSSGGLFDDLPQAWATPPTKPFGTSHK